ncbi:MAG TPA: tRNA (adenosine(37)-N6)-threonylcarbamoyltransferase complex dimerization subunit type 1 TsaB [Acidobacteriota bacterium]|nr:tRNA (adenosine(37)-N6)-threonylcarbamoyltransferase complex dimerization subunit type 1 TsaB [Acidobacteriota bacterium]
MNMHGRPNFRTLALDTSTPRGSVALLDGNDLVAEVRLKSLETHSARLLRSVEFLLDSAQWTLGNVDLIAAGIGPGSFTGIRIGIATAMGLAQPMGIPFAGVSGLDALAGQIAFLAGSIGVVMDAQRAQVYYAEYISDGVKIRKTVKPEVLNPFELELRLQKRHLYIIVDRDLRCCERLFRPGRGWPRAIAGDLFLASAIGSLAFRKRRYWKSGDYLTAEPLYIRPPDALRAKHRK